MFAVPDPDESTVEWFADLLVEQKYSELISHARNKEVKNWVKGLQQAMSFCSIEVDDLHEGNIGVRNDGSIVFFDYGNVTLLEQNTLASGNVVGYMAPLGAKGIGSDSSLEKGFWRKDSGKSVKTASPALHKKKTKKSLYEEIFSEMALSKDSKADMVADSLRSYIEKLRKTSNITEIEVHRKFADYCSRQYVLIGKGAFRSVYEIDDNIALKVIRQFGTDDNMQEVEHKKCLDDEYFTKIYAFDNKEYYWLICERVKQAKVENIITILKDKLKGTLYQKKLESYISDPRRYLDEFISLCKQIIEGKSENFTDPWLIGFIENLKRCKHHAIDFNMNNWGIRPNGDLVVLDYAF